MTSLLIIVEHLAEVRYLCRTHIKDQAVLISLQNKISGVTAPGAVSPSMATECRSRDILLECPAAHAMIW